MDDLITRLRAAIDQDERLARYSGGTGNWTARSARHGGTGNEWDVVEGKYPVATVRGSTRVQHIAHHDPARVLRQVAAHRKILEIHKRHPDPYNTSESACQQCDEARHETWFSEEQGCPTILALAEAYGITP